VVLGLDIGDCLSRRDVPSADGDLCYRSAAEGAYAFLVLFTAKYGAEVVRFAKQFGLPACGVPDSHIHVVTSQKSVKYGKGPIAKDLGLTHMVDDMECLWSALFDPVFNASDTLEQVIQFTSLQPRRPLPNNIRGTWPQDAQHRLVRLRTWHDVAKYFDLTCTSELWESISRRGPPHCPPMRPTSKEMVKLARILAPAASAGAAATAPAADLVGRPAGRGRLAGRPAGRPAATSRARGTRRRANLIDEGDQPGDQPGEGDQPGDQPGKGDQWREEQE
jgi:hypothetical protein